jgi:hypothetical protein
VDLATEDVCIFYGHLVYVFYRQLVYFVACLYNLWPFDVFFPGMLCQEKSGNPDENADR